jgi:hypothetical protein
VTDLGCFEVVILPFLAGGGTCTSESLSVPESEVAGHLGGMRSKSSKGDSHGQQESRTVW